jgi:hypothetical protein
MTTLAECQKLFSLLCKLDDKHLRLQKMKYNEELGEFFREYLIYCSKFEGLRSMAHREFSIDNLMEETIDCIIVSTRIKGEVLPGWKPKLHSLLPDFTAPDFTAPDEALLNIAYAVAEGNPNLMAFNLSRLISEDHYHEILMKKLKKWESILTQNGLLHA